MDGGGARVAVVGGLGVGAGRRVVGLRVSGGVDVDLRLVDRARRGVRHDRVVEPAVAVGDGVAGDAQGARAGVGAVEGRSEERRGGRARGAAGGRDGCRTGSRSWTVEGRGLPWWVGSGSGLVVVSWVFVSGVA